MNVKLINFRPIAALTAELAYSLKQIEGLPFLKDFRHEYRAPQRVKVPTIKVQAINSAALPG